MRRAWSWAAARRGDVFGDRVIATAILDRLVGVGALLGRKISRKKAASSRTNGRKGGRSPPAAQAATCRRTSFEAALREGC